MSQWDLIFLLQDFKVRIVLHFIISFPFQAVSAIQYRQSASFSHVSGIPNQLLASLVCKNWQRPIRKRYFTHTHTNTHEVNMKLLLNALHKHTNLCECVCWRLLRVPALCCQEFPDSSSSMVNVLVETFSVKNFKWKICSTSFLFFLFFSINGFIYAMNTFSIIFCCKVVKFACASIYLF